MTALGDLQIHHRLNPTDIDSVCALIDRVMDHDGLHPLSEHVWLHLRHGGDEHDEHLIIKQGTTVIGYAHLDATDAVAGASGEVVVDPDYRRLGLGRRLVEAMIELTSDGRLRLWAHGELEGGVGLTRSLGFANTRLLWQMRRSLRLTLAAPVWPAGISVRTFRPGLDEQAWLAINARAFAHHPEQGSWQETDLLRRMDEPWFSPEGFLIAIADATGGMAAFHWTKVHGSRATDHAHGAIGEVYVVGVDPVWQGTGLGRAMTIAGLHHLRALGLDQAMLYVDATNTGAIRLYESLGFARWDTDVLYQRSPDTGS